MPSVDTGYLPRPWQAEVHRSLRRFSVLVVHRRGGKTVLAVNALIDAAARCTKRAPRFGYVAPFLKQARKVSWEYVRHYTAAFPGVQYNESNLTCTLPNGAEIALHGADNPDALRGQYWDGVVLDEVADMRPNVWGSIIRPGLADRHGWAVFIGTPKGINLFSELYFKAQQEPSWFARLYTVNDTDALLPEEVEQARRDMSESQFAAEFLCDFHAAVADALMSVEDVTAAMSRAWPKASYDFAPRVMGVDVAGYGGDRSVIAKRQGVVSHGHTKLRDVSPMALASRVCQEAEAFKPEAIFIDTGYAPGVCDRVEQLGFPAIGVSFGSRPSEERFENKRAEMWWRLADWIKEAALPNDHELLNDLCAPTYSLKNRHGRIQLESKDDLRKRGMPSPDIGDAYALTFAEMIDPAVVEWRDGYAPSQFTNAVSKDYMPY